MLSFSRLNTALSRNGSGLPASWSNPLLRVPWFALAGVDLAREVGIALEHHLPVRVVHGEHEGARAHRIPVEREVSFRHAGLREEALGLLRYRREEGHGEPVPELRILALELDPVGITIDDLGAGERKLREIEIGALAPRARELLVRLLERRRKLLQSDDVLAHQTEHRRMQARVRQALDLINVVGGRQLARAGLFEVPQLIHTREILRLEIVIARPTRSVLRKCRVGLIENARPDADLVHAVRHRVRVGIVGQALALGIQVDRPRHLDGSLGDQLVRSLVVVVLQRRLVDLRRERRFVLAVGLDGIEVLRALGERRIVGIGAGVARRVRIVPGRTRAAGKQAGEDERTDRSHRT